MEIVEGKRNNYGFSTEKDSFPSIFMRLENSIIHALYGPLNKNLLYLEKNLDVHIEQKGNEIRISGTNPDAIANANCILVHLIEVARGSQEFISEEDIDAAIQFLTIQDGGKAISAGQISTSRRIITPRSKNQNIYIQEMERSDIVFGVGAAGTGKTFLAVAHAVSLLEKKEIRRLILSRPAVEAGERLGFLPGDLREKIDPYLRPLYSALYDMMPSEKVERAIALREIEILPLAFMRGLTLSNAVIILDEAQNTTSTQMKMFLTRLGENSRMIITGDPDQIDLPANVSSGLVEALSLLKKTEGIGAVYFNEKDVVRHALVKKILKAYEKGSSARGVRDLAQ